MPGCGVVIVLVTDIANINEAWLQGEVVSNAKGTKIPLDSKPSFARTACLYRLAGTAETIRMQGRAIVCAWMSEIGDVNSGAYDLITGMLGTTDYQILLKCLRSLATPFVTAHLLFYHLRTPTDQFDKNSPLFDVWKSCKLEKWSFNGTTSIRSPIVPIYEGISYVLGKYLTASTDKKPKSLDRDVLATFLVCFCVKHIFFGRSFYVPGVFELWWMCVM